jgi:hypothetical protein
MASESNEAIDELYRSLGGSLVEAEHGRDALASDLERRRTELLLAWDREVLRTREKTLEALRDTSAASRSRMDEAVDRWFATIRSELGGDGAAAADLLDRATNLGRAMNGLAEASAVMMGASLPAEPRPSFTEEEAIAAALSQSLAPGEEPLLGGSSHPGYAQFLDEVHRATGELIERASAHGASVAELIRALQELQERQVAEYAKVLSDRRITEMGVRRRRDEAVAALERESEEALAQRDREVLRLESLLEGAQPALERAAIERAASAVQNVRLAVPAVASQSPLGTGLGRSVLIAALVGWLVGTALSALWTISRE